jgi:hypothetical protein
MSKNIESNAHLRAFRKSKRHLLEQVRILLGHGPRFVADPEILDVLLASPPSQPRVPEAAKGMPAHPRFVKLHGFEAFCKPRSSMLLCRCGVPFRVLNSNPSWPHMNSLRYSATSGCKSMSRYAASVFS